MDSIVMTYELVAHIIHNFISMSNIMAASVQLVKGGWSDINPASQKHECSLINNNDSCYTHIEFILFHLFFICSVVSEVLFLAVIPLCFLSACSVLTAVLGCFECRSLLLKSILIKVYYLSENQL